MQERVNEGDDVEVEVIRQIGQRLPELRMSVEQGRHAELKVLIPRCASEAPWTGFVALSTRKGEVQLRAADATRDRVVGVNPSLSQYSFTKSGEVPLEYWSALAAGVAGLADPLTIFRAGERHGRRIGKSDKLRWGDLVWLICSETSPLAPLEAPEVSEVLELIELEFVRGWDAFQLQLPRKPDPLASEAIQAALGLAIADAPADLLLLDPFPHHFSDEGEWVVPHDARSLRFFRSESSPIRIEQLDAEYTVTYDPISDDVIDISGLGKGLFVFHLGSSASLDVRLDVCGRLIPRSIAISSSAGTFSTSEIARSSEVRALLRRIASTLTIQVPDAAVLQTISVNRAKWSSLEDFKHVLSVSSQEVVFQIASFVTIIFEALYEPTRAAQGACQLSDESRRTRDIALDTLATSVVNQTRVGVQSAGYQFDGRDAHAALIPIPLLPQYRSMLKSRNGGRR